ncbi:PREDICTED: ATP-binding cassette sub-family A member 10, partial [Chrysochloris asiatica]|uniref:ATP-binding cassette sub-family A member 10 n=1 Tax=Chrysochloris asiatica TaxID=185453 RepID=A0A9B0TXZ0_CHRAS
DATIIGYSILDGLFIFLLAANCIAPYIGMNSISDYKTPLITFIIIISNELGNAALFSFMILIPPFTLIGFLLYLAKLTVVYPMDAESLNSGVEVNETILLIILIVRETFYQNMHSSLMAYKLPVGNVHPLSQAFSKLEAVKQTFDLEEYSLSQSTLEQVFLELSKEQELGNFDDEIDATVRWKLLPQEEP